MGNEQALLEAADRQGDRHTRVIQPPGHFTGAAETPLELRGMPSAEAKMSDEATLFGLAATTQRRALRHAAAFEQRRDQHERPELSRIPRVHSHLLYRLTCHTPKNDQPAGSAGRI